MQLALRVGMVVQGRAVNLLRGPWNRWWEVRLDGGRSNWGKLRHLFVQGLVIVFSVLFALLAENSWAERKAKHDAAVALAVLELEIRANLEELEGFLVVVSERYDRLIATEPTIDGSRPFSDYVGNFGGYRHPDLDVSAWERVRSDPLANRVAPERLREAFILYRNLETLLTLDHQVSRLVFGPLYHDPDEAEIGYRISERILSQQIQFAEIMASQHRDFLDVGPTGSQ